MLTQTYAGQITVLAGHLFGVRFADVISISRNRDFVRARQAAMSALRDVKGYSLPTLGRAFRRDHTTVLHAIRSVQRLNKTDADFAKKYALLLQEAEALNQTIIKTLRQQMDEQIKRLGPRICATTVCSLAGYGKQTLKKRIREGRMPNPIDRGREEIFDRDAVLQALKIRTPEQEAQW
jgi:hypothetical protein